jgi:sulfur carrier protein
MITLTINGKAQTLERPLGLIAYLEAKGVLGKRVAVGINGEVVHKDQWASITLREGDVVDIVQMVGGG